MDATALFEQKLAQVLMCTNLPPRLCEQVAAALMGKNQQRTFYVPATNSTPQDWWHVLATLDLAQRKIAAFPQLVSIWGAAENIHRKAVTQEYILDSSRESRGTTVWACPELTDAVVSLEGDHVQACTENGLHRLTCNLALFQPGEAFWTLYPQEGYDGELECYARTEAGWIHHCIVPAWPTVTDSNGNEHNLGAVIYGMMAMLPTQ